MLLESKLGVSMDLVAKRGERREQRSDLGLDGASIGLPDPGVDATSPEEAELLRLFWSDVLHRLTDGLNRAQRPGPSCQIKAVMKGNPFPKDDRQAAAARKQTDLHDPIPTGR